MLSVLDLQVMLFMIAGLIAGIVVGALPGLTATMGVALLVPLTYWLDPLPAMMVLLGVYVGAMYGGAIPAILIRTPGTPAAAATSFDGYPLAKQGRAGVALGMACVAGVIGGVFSTLVLMFASPSVAKFALQFGPPEYFALAVFGLTIIASLSAQSLAKGLLMGVGGLLLSTVGMDPITAVPRFTFGMQELLDGVPFIAVLIGVFALAEVFHQASQKAELVPASDQWGRVLPSKDEMKQVLPSISLSCVSGTLIGALPGVGGDVAAFVAYDHAKKISKTPEQFGNGSLEGLAAAECANNSVTGGAMIPMLTMGIPGDSVTAVLLGGMMIHGLKPGPELFQKEGDLVHAIFLGLLLANLLVLPIGLLGAKWFAQTMRLPRQYLLPLIVVLCTVGAYAINNSFFDVGVAYLFGLIGWALKRWDFPLGPLVLGLILGRMAEENLRRALILSSGSPSIFLTHPIALVLLLGAVLSVAYSLHARSK
jgi:putative tricarboxylic transport membrane protein